VAPTRRPSASFDEGLRQAALAWLDELSRHGQELLTFDQVAAFRFEGRRIPLLDRQRGIRKPADLDAALSFRTTFTPPGQVPPYEDAEGPDGLLRYKYRGDDPQHPENVALRRAYERRLPLIWFYGIAPGVYLPRYPVWLVADEPERLQFAVAMYGAQLLVPPETELGSEQRRYVERLTKLRLHQPVFRARVLQAYERSCAMCRLRHLELLDAAHILPDTHPRGLPVVPNGLALCKIHHAAYDRDIVGVRPDLVVEVRRDILDEIDGPMLEHGLKEMAGVRLSVPRQREARPHTDLLEERYEQFRRAG
jgi:putative restriction endonuclease